MTFRQVFEQTDVSACIEPGLRALGQHSRFVECADRQQLEGSVDIDRCLAAQYPREHRWDYAFGFRNRIFYVEIHHVTDSEVDVMIAKYQWLRDWQNRQANSDALKRNSTYHWISSGRGSLTKRSSYMRRIIKSGLGLPQKTLRIDP